MLPRTTESFCGECRAIVEISCTIVFSPSSPSAPDKPGVIVVLYTSINSACGIVCKNCDNVTMVRFRTAGRGWLSNGAITSIASDCTAAVDTKEGKREMRIDKIDNVSINVSGGVEASQKTSECSDMKFRISTYIFQLSEQFWCQFFASVWRQLAFLR